MKFSSDDSSIDVVVDVLKKNLPDTDAPGFAATIDKAERQVSARRRVRFASAAAVIVGLLGLSVLQLQQQTSAPTQALADELMQSTRWAAPSDVLLPQRGTDIYSELPAWPVSTESQEGTLL